MKNTRNTTRVRTLAPPASLGPDARARWTAVAPILAARGPVDAGLLATYCQVWARWQQAEQGITKSGALVRTARGGIAASPLLAVSNRAATQLRELEKALGLDGAAAAPAHASPASSLLTRRQLAAALGVHMMTVTKWERDGMPVADRGAKGRPSYYREADVRAWQQQRDQAAREPGATVDLARERARKERAQAILAEQTYKVRSGELLPRDGVEKVWAAEVAAARAVLLSWQSTLADRVFRVAISEGVGGVERVLQDAVHDVLRELANPERPTLPPASPPDTDAAA